jgi:hypothetical protein
MAELFIYESLFKGKRGPSFAKVKAVLDFVDIKKLRKWNWGGHRLLHEAIEQSDSYKGAVTVLCVAWCDPRLRPLFTDKSYRDKYGACPARRLWNKKPAVGSVGFKILTMLWLENPRVPWLKRHTFFDYEARMYGRAFDPALMRQKLGRHLGFLE